MQDDIIQHWFDNPFIDPAAEGFYPVKEDINDYLPSYEESGQHPVDLPLWINDHELCIQKKDEYQHYLIWERLSTVLGHAMGAPVAPQRLSIEDGVITAFSLVMGDFDEAKGFEWLDNRLSRLDGSPEAATVFLDMVFGSHARAYNQMARVMALDLLTQNDDVNWWKHAIFAPDIFYVYDYALVNPGNRSPLEMHGPWGELRIDVEELAWSIPAIIRDTNWSRFDAECKLLGEALPNYEDIIGLMRSHVYKWAEQLKSAPPIIGCEYPYVEPHEHGRVICNATDTRFLLLNPMCPRF